MLTDTHAASEKVTNTIASCNIIGWAEGTLHLVELGGDTPKILTERNIDSTHFGLLNC